MFITCMISHAPRSVHPSWNVCLMEKSDIKNRRNMDTLYGPEVWQLIMRKIANWNVNLCYIMWLKYGRQNCEFPFFTFFVNLVYTLGRVNGPDHHLCTHSNFNFFNNYSGYGIYTGQNLAWGYGTWDAAIQGWFNEVKDFQFGTGSTNGKAVGHYTQVHIFSSVGKYI